MGISQTMGVFSMYQAKGRDCIFYILRRWKSIIIVALICALLMCGLDVFKTVRRWNKDKKQCEIDAIEYQDALKVAQDQEDVYDNQIESNYAKIEVLRENPIIEYDATKIGTSTVFLQFDEVTNEEGAVVPFPTGLMSLYSNAITDITDWDKVGKKGDLDGVYAKSLFSYTVDTTGRSIYLKIHGKTEKESAAMLKEILKQIDAYTETLDADTRASFSYSQVNSLTRVGNEDGFVAIQDGINNRIRDLNNEVVNLNNIKGEIEYPVEPPTMPTKADVVKSIIKYFVFGCAVGGCGMVALYYVFFYLNNKMNAVDEFDFYTGVGAMAFDNLKKGKLDRFIAKKENRGLLYSQDAAVLRTVNNIKLSHPEVTKIMFTGIDSEKQVKAIKASLEKTKDLGLQYGLEKNILTDTEAYDHLKYYDAVVLVEKLDKISNTLIKKEVEQIGIAGKKVVGGLVIR